MLLGSLQWESMPKAILCFRIMNYNSRVHWSRLEIKTHQEVAESKVAASISKFKQDNTLRSSGEDQEPKLMALQPKRTISKEDKGNITVDFDIYAPREGNSLTQLRKSRAVADNSVVLQRNLHNTSQTDRKVTSGYSIQS